MKALTLHQPWASLVALGVKRLETRSWSTRYRGPLAIHAGMATPQTCDQWEIRPDALGTLMAHLAEPWTEEEQVAAGFPADGNLHGFPIPLGAVVATCTLADVVPMVTLHGRPGEDPTVHLSIDGPHGLLLCRNWQQVDVTDEGPYGEFAPGRFAWVLEDVQPCNPEPARGRQGLWEWER